MKILFYTPFTKMGGIELVAAKYLQMLASKGYEIDLIIDFDLGKEGNVTEHNIPKEVNFYYIKTKKISKFICWLRALGKKNKMFNLFLYGFMIFFDFYFYHTKVKAFLQRKKYDYTITFYQFLPTYLTKFSGTKHIIWLHGSVEHFFDGFTKLFIKSYGRKLNKYDYIVSICHEMKEQVKEYYPSIPEEKLKMIYNPFLFTDSIEKSNDIASLSQQELNLLNDKYICTVTRIDEHQKDLTTLILAYEQLYLNKEIVEKLYIIGNGTSKAKLERIVKDKNLENKIIFLGIKLNVFIWMKHAKIFILSSKFEGLPLALIEAMIVKTFIISSNFKTGAKELLQDGYCGDLFEIGNVYELANKITHALNNSQYRKEKIINASTRIKEFSDDKGYQNLAKLLKAKA